MEISRIAAPGAMMVMHIELSNSFEFFLTPHYRADAAFIKTFYQGEESLWVYSDRHVRQVLDNARFRIVDTHYFHIASALAYRLLKKRAILTIADSISLWRSHGFRLPAKKMRQPICSRAGKRSILMGLTRL